MEAESGPFSDWQRHEKKVVLKVTLVRHGETVANRDRLVQGQTPGELTEFGREQVGLCGNQHQQFA
jgi:bisphosphoglycerate-dependent phosphoglycerate mutase